MNSPSTCSDCPHLVRLGTFEDRLTTSWVCDLVPTRPAISLLMANEGRLPECPLAAAARAEKDEYVTTDGCPQLVGSTCVYVWEEYRTMPQWVRDVIDPSDLDWVAFVPTGDVLPYRWKTTCYSYCRKHNIHGGTLYESHH